MNDDIRSPSIDLLALPKRGKDAAFLAKEFADEGVKVILSDGEQVSYNPPPAKPVIPDFSGVKSIRHYFHRTGFSPWPAWVYHPTEEKRLLKNAEEGIELGIVYRKTSVEEQAKTGLTAQWDWEPGCEWRTKPFPKDLQFDSTKLHGGKEVIHRAKTGMESQNELLNAVLPQITKVILDAMKETNASNATPKDHDANDWAEFQQFLAFKKGEKVTKAVISVTAPADFDAGAENALLAQHAEANKLTEDQETVLWREEAKRRDIKIDKRWSLQTLRETVENALLETQ
jgi:hypothetical protein